MLTELNVLSRIINLKMVSYTQVLKELLMQRDKDVEEYQAAMQANKRKEAELSANLQSLEEVAASAGDHDEAHKHTRTQHVHTGIFLVYSSPVCVICSICSI